MDDPAEIFEDVYHTFVYLNNRIDEERRKAEAESGYTRMDINRYIEQWLQEEKKGVCTFTVPQELLQFFLVRGATLKFLRDHPEIHRYIVPYVRPGLSVSL